MNRGINIEYRISDKEEKMLSRQLKKAEDAYKRLKENEFSMTGWLDYPKEIPDDLYEQIYNITHRIKNNYSAIVIVGIGGSYLGIRAAMDFILNRQEDSNIKIFFAGMNLSTGYHEKVLEDLKEENPALLIISKSGTTTETLIAGNIFMNYLKGKYKEDYRDRIYVITNPEKGVLREIAIENGYPTLPIPDNIGGRFSVLTSVGLLPMAVAGIDIKEVIKGANSAAESELTEDAVKLAAVRNIFESNGLTVELLTDFEPGLTNLIQWVRQLYGESEGKDGKGMLPVNIECTRDLHSLGQFIQDGRQIFSETVFSIKEKKGGIDIPGAWGISDRDITLEEVNDAARLGVIAAHNSDGIPVIQIEIPARDDYSFGQIIYFLQISCAVRGIMMGVNPFDQPGVEKYKQEMKKRLKI